MSRSTTHVRPVSPFLERTLRIEGEPLPRNIGALLDEAAQAVPDREALVFIDSGETFTYRALRADVHCLVSGLRAIGIDRGTHVGIMLPNIPEWPLSWLAMARIGAIAVPVNTRSTGRELHYVLTDAQAQYLIIHDSFLPVLAAVPEPLAGIADRIVVTGENASGHHDWHDLARGSDADLPPLEEPCQDDLINIQYTSGSTGLPKGCLLTQRYWLQVAKTHSAGDDQTYERALAPTPFFYMTPQWLVLFAFFQRGTLYVAARQSASRFAEWLHRYRINFCLFPAAAYKQPPSPQDAANNIVRVSTYGFPPQNQADLQRRFDFIAREAFGMTEIGAGLSVPIEAEDMTGSGSVGLPTPFRECRIADIEGNTLAPGMTGELLFRGPGMLKGYYNNPAATAAAFHGDWFRSGDLARQDARGYVYIVGRAKDMIRRAGENISAFEVESVVAGLDGVAEVAALPVPDDMRGEEVKICVVLRDGLTQQELPPDMIWDYCTTNLASFKIPRYIEYRSEPLPRTGSEKIAKTELLKEKPDQISDSWDRIESRLR